MKFMVLCVLDLEHVASAETVLDGLAGLGLAVVEPTTNDGERIGCVLGQFRAADPHALEHQLRADIETRLRRMQVQAGLRIFVQPLETESAQIIQLHARRG
jgi:hypothetical protein